MSVIDEKLEELQNFTVRYIKTIAMDIVVVLVAVAYIFYQMVTLEPNDINPLVLLAQAFMGIVCGVAIKQALGENGFSRGYNSIIWKEEEDKYNAACNTANPYMERVDNFYQYEEIEKKRNYRRTKLQGIRCKYDDWFDKEGNYIGYPLKELKAKGYDRKQIRVIKKCIRVRIYPLNLFSQYNISVDQDTKREKTDKTQRARNFTTNTVSATLIAIIGVYFIPMLSKWSWASFISSTMQVTMWVLFGILQLFNNYNFVVQDKTALLRQKKEGIRRFTTGCEKGMYTHSPYDDDVASELTNEKVEEEKVEEAAKKLPPLASIDI